MLKTTPLFTVLFTLIVMTAPAGAQSNRITKDMITAQYQALEQALNNSSDTMGKIQTLHAQISDDAQFKMTVTNPDIGKAKSPVMEMNKQDYINTYIQGTHFITDYEVDIRNVSFEPGDNANEAYTTDLMIERGKMLNALNDGKPFVSRTTCRTRHEMRDGTLVAAGSACHTDISYEEEI